jgi:hypothetical protein
MHLENITPFEQMLQVLLWTTACTFRWNVYRWRESNFTLC